MQAYKSILKKYKFGVEYIKYLKFIVSINRIKVDPKKVNATYN